MELQGFLKSFWDKKPVFLVILTSITSCAHKKQIIKQVITHVTGIEKEFNNFHSVQPGFLYRSAQLSPEFLEKMIKKLGIKTIINLRGKNEKYRWWRKERAITKKLGVIFYNIPMTARQLPQKKHILTLLNIYQKASPPILIHCYSGSDRTGEAAALWVLECQKLNKKTALKQLSLKYGHLEFKHPNKRRFIKLWQGKKWLIHEYNSKINQKTISLTSNIINK